MRCEVADDQSDECLYPLAHAIAVFVEKNTDLWLHRLMERNFTYLSAAERLWVLGRALSSLYKSNRKSRIDRIAVAILPFVSVHEILIIEGIQDFLLKEIADELNAVLGMAVDEYFFKREEDEYIQFLRRYSTWYQQSRLYVRVTYDNPFIGTKEHGTSEVSQNMGTLYPTISSSEDYDDFIVISLLKASPAHIVLQGAFPNTVIQLLSDIFPGRVFHDSSGPKRNQSFHS